MKGMAEMEVDGQVLNQDEVRRIRLLDYIALITIFNMSLYLVAYSVADFQLFKPAILTLGVSIVPMAATILLNRRGFHLLSRILLSFLVPIPMICVSTFVFGKAPGFQVYLFVAAIIPLFLWSYREWMVPLVFIVLSLASYVLIQFLPAYAAPLITLPESHIRFFNQSNLSVGFFMAGLAIVGYQHLYRKQQERLITQTEALKTTQAYRDKIFSVIGHDLRGPLATFGSLTELFVSRYDALSDEERLRIAGSMQRSTESMKELLENLMEWSRMQSGKTVRTDTEIDLGNMVVGIVEIYRDAVREKDLELKVELPSGLMLRADAHMSSAIVRNLLSNALKFTDKGGRIHVSARRQEDMVRICVEDTGVGMGPEKIAELFDIRKGRSRSGTEKGSGSGLGLLLCKDFVDAHGGTIRVESEEGKGSKICFTLPHSSTPQ